MGSFADGFPDIGKLIVRLLLAVGLLGLLVVGLVVYILAR